jgi:hypothetical protein
VRSGWPRSAAPDPVRRFTLIALLVLALLILLNALLRLDRPDPEPGASGAYSGPAPRVSII